jgi:hypothetical protein
LSSLILLGLQPPVKDCLQREPGLLPQVQELSRAVSAAGVRVRDAGLLKDMFDSNLAVYTPEEVWTFDLGFDVVALLGALDGLTGEVRANMASNRQSFDRYAHNDAWRNAMEKAGDGPVAWTARGAAAAVRRCGAAGRPRRLATSRAARPGRCRAA